VATHTSTLAFRRLGRRQPAAETSPTGVEADSAQIEQVLVNLVHHADHSLSDQGRVDAAGLGLATVYGIVKQSEGFIWVDGAGGGTTFRIYFPRLTETLAA
jgi:two-component system cell cycle sensor histidine kinase/response regulator CckA